MEWIELFMIAVGLSMDAFAVSVCKGLSTSTLRLRYILSVGIWFGGFQALMPLLGYLLGERFSAYILPVNHWIAFILLVLIGVNMIRESTEGEVVSHSFSPGVMLPLAIATSIDALAVGITFAFLQVRILPAVSLIGTATFTLSGLGLWIGYLSGIRYRKYAEICGGIVLVLMGIKILLEHLGILA